MLGPATPDRKILANTTFWPKKKTSGYDILSGTRVTVWSNKVQVIFVVATVCLKVSAFGRRTLRKPWWFSLSHMGLGEFA